MDNQLLNKMRFHTGHRILIMNAPTEMVEQLPKDVKPDLKPEGLYDFVLLFIHSISELEQLSPHMLKAVDVNALLWIAYPKKSSKLQSDINRDTGWNVIKEAGYEGVAMVSVDDTWSAMRFRRTDMVKSSGGRRERLNSGGERTPVRAPKDRVLAIPDDLKNALNQKPEIMRFFEGLAYSHRKEYIRWITEAKREETRTSRLEKTLEKLSLGIKAPHLKE